jgi:prevent-host-death family protein
MQTVNIHEAKTHLSRLLARIADGESIIIAKAGKPVAKLVPVVDADAPLKRRIGFMEGEISLPADFDTMMQDEIEAMFYGYEEQ